MSQTFCNSFSQVISDFWATEVVSMSDSKTLPNREANFLLLQRWMSFFLDTKEISWLMNFALTLCGNGSRLLLFSLFPQNRFAQQLFVGYWISQGAAPVPAENQWSALVLGEKAIGTEPFWGESCLVKVLSAAAKTNKANSPHGHLRTHGVERSLLVAQSTGWEHLWFEGASSPFWLTTSYKAHFHLIYLFWLSNKQVMSHLLSS